MHWFGANDQTTLEDVVTFLRQQAEQHRFTATHMATTKRDQGQYQAAARALVFAANYIEEAIPNGPTPQAVLDRSAARKVAQS